MPWEHNRYEDLKQVLILQHINDEVLVTNAASLTGKFSQPANDTIYTDIGKIIKFHNRKPDTLIRPDDQVSS